MKKNATTKHFTNDRLDRATYIATHVGFGEIVVKAQAYNSDNLLTNYELTETGVMIVRSMDNSIVTMFVATTAQVFRIYEWANSHAPRWILEKSKKNAQKGFVKNQPKC